MYRCANLAMDNGNTPVKVCHDSQDGYLGIVGESVLLLATSLCLCDCSNTPSNHEVITMQQNWVKFVAAVLFIVVLLLMMSGRIGADELSLASQEQTRQVFQEMKDKGVFGMPVNLGRLISDSQGYQLIMAVDGKPTGRFKAVIYAGKPHFASMRLEPPGRIERSWGSSEMMLKAITDYFGGSWDKQTRMGSYECASWWTARISRFVSPPVPGQPNPPKDFTLELLYTSKELGADVELPPITLVSLSVSEWPPLPAPAVPVDKKDKTV